MRFYLATNILIFLDKKLRTKPLNVAFSFRLFLYEINI